MSILAIDFEFDFPTGTEDGGSQKHSMVIDLDTPPYSPEILKEYLANYDLTDEDDFENAMYEVDSWLQSEVILENLKYSNYEIDDDGRLSFDLVLTIGTATFSSRDSVWIDDPDDLTDATPEQFDEAIESVYFGSHHYFDILDIKGVYTP